MPGVEGLTKVSAPEDRPTSGTDLTGIKTGVYYAFEPFDLADNLLHNCYMTTPLHRVPDFAPCSVQIVPVHGSPAEPKPHLGFHSAPDRSADRLFAVLDHSDVVVQGHRTPVEVYTVTD